MRCQRSDFPREEIDKLYQRVRDLAKDAVIGHGFQEIEAREQHMLDPGDKGKTLDTWYELVFSRVLEGVEQAIEEVKRLLKLEKYVTHQ
ncbi:MAG: hypothetical protein NVS3B20_24600 [Polyangiales bacterium]